MDELARELRQTLAEMAEPDSERTFIAPSPVLRESAPRRVRATPRRRWPLYALLVLLAAGAIAAGVLGLGGSKGGKTNAPPGSGGPVALSGVTAYDPEGSRGEHDSDAPNATDGNPTTFWTTEHYRSFTKSGVGVVLDAGRTAALKSVTVTSDTPGFTASILGGSSSSGGFSPDSSSHVVSSRTTFTLDGHDARYYVVWITELGGNVAVHVNEVKATA
jgi:hypothetical protein